MPAIVLEIEKTGRGLLSMRTKNFVNDSGITLKFDINAANPKPSFVFGILPIALFRTQNQKTPDMA